MTNKKAERKERSQHVPHGEGTRKKSMGDSVHRATLMMKMEVNKFHITLAFLSVVIPKVTAAKAEIYNTQSFELIRSSSYPHFVMFYAPW